jgi:hypothetical protein
MAIPAHKQAPLERGSAPIRPRTLPPLPISSREPPLGAPGGTGKTILLAFLVSLSVHLLVLLLAPGLFRRDPLATRFPLPVGRSSQDAPQLLLELPGVPDGTPVAAAPAAPPATPQRNPDAGPRVGVAAPSTGGSVDAPAPGAPPGIAAPGGQPDVPGAGAGTPGRSAIEALRPAGVPDARLWTLDPAAAELSEEQLFRLEILWAIEDMNAEAAAAAIAARKLTDWTYTDDSGKRWGFSDGKIYLGDLVLPFPFAFSAPVNGPAAQRALIDAEIDRAAGSAAARETLKERVKAIRERLDAERRRARGDTTQVGPRPRP